jgi:GntR family transcriptional regulator/MocR family aminotransferase
MAELTFADTTLHLAMDRRSSQSLHRQLYGALRDGIVTGTIAPGTRLPSTRAMAAELRVGRNTVIAAFEQLLAEGFLDSRVGSGTHVVDLFPGPAPAPRTVGLRPGTAALSRRGQRLAAGSRGALPERTAFAPGLPALDRFPFASWNRFLTRAQRTAAAADLGYRHAAGHPDLRRAIAGYLRRSRGVRCEPEQVLVVSGAQAALDLTVRMLVDPGEPVWLEDPGYLGARGALRGAGVSIVPVPLDDEGLDVATGIARAGGARLAYVTPSFQFPTGITMSLERRLALLRWAARNNAWIIEDDYDSEYRYRSRPLSALQGIDADGRVIYTGTFSKTLYPALRLGYLVVPRHLASAFVTAIRHTGHSTPVLPQLALAQFIEQGAYASHLRRMRSLYARRQRHFVARLQDVLGDELEARVPDGGMQLPAHFTAGHDDDAIASAAASQGLHLSPLSGYYLEAPPRKGLYLGFAGVPEEQVEPGLRQLATLLRQQG